MKRSDRWVSQRAEASNLADMSKMPAQIKTGPGGESVQEEKGKTAKGERIFNVDTSKVDGEDIVE